MVSGTTCTRVSPFPNSIGFLHWIKHRMPAQGAIIHCYATLPCLVYRMSCIVYLVSPMVYRHRFSRS